MVEEDSGIVSKSSTMLNGDKFKNFEEKKIVDSRDM
jgi:hypothetical protein